MIRPLRRARALEGLDIELPCIFGVEGSGIESDELGVYFDHELPRDIFAASPEPPREPRAPGTQKKKSARDSGPLVEGAIIDKYRIEELVATGGSSVVYRATHLPLARPVAIKMLRAAKDMGQGAQQLFNEARFAARIDHPNVVRVVDVYTSDALSYVVMEFIEGKTLAQTIKAEGRLDERRVAWLGLDVTRGLAAGLEQGLVHRDIKPANILITRHGQAKIVDLGLARPSSGSDNALGVAGTPGYIAPELFSGRGGRDFRSDVYSLGVTLYEAVVGALPFPNDDAKRCRELSLSAEAASPASLVHGLDAGLSRLILWMMARDPRERPRHYDQLAEAFEQTIARITGPTSGDRS